MSWLEITTLAILPSFLLLDFVHRAYWPQRPRGWRWRAGVVTGFNFWLSLVVGQAWGSLFDGFSVFDGRALGTAGGAVVGVLVYELVHYVYHRTVHRVDWLWRLTHQMHHSAETLDPWGAYFLHPIDAALFVTWSSLVLFPLLGLSPEAGAWAAAFLTFAAVFQHADLRTPHWLGYLIQRPESHAIHHARGVHAFNYADLPLWDLVFGTFRNGPATPPRQGLADRAWARLAAMLSFRDVAA